MDVEERVVNLRAALREECGLELGTESVRLLLQWVEEQRARRSGAREESGGTAGAEAVPDD